MSITSIQFKSSLLTCALCAAGLASPFAAHASEVHGDFNANSTKYYSAEERQVDEVGKVALPALRSFGYVVEQIARDRREDVRLGLTFEASGRSDPGATAWTIVCPHEFGDACDLLIEAVLAFGGECWDTIHNDICEFPD